MVLVTSRHMLTGLAAGEGAHLIPLGGLAEGESYGLLARLLDGRQVVADPEAIGELTALCARLPLALCNAAARAAAHPELPLATVVAEMQDDRARLDALETGEASTSVRVLFAQSHARLSDLASGTFQMLGMHPGPEITVPAAASLARLDRTRAQAAISELCDEHLLTEHADGRYACHELLRVYAAEAARTRVSESRRRAAVYRMLDHYLHTAAAMSAILFPYLIPRRLDPPRPGVLPESVRLGEDAAAREHLARSSEMTSRLSGGRFRTPRPGAEVARSRDGIRDALVQAGRALRLYRVEPCAVPCSHLIMRPRDHVTPDETVWPSGTQAVLGQCAAPYPISVPDQGWHHRGRPAHAVARAFSAPPGDRR